MNPHNPCFSCSDRVKQLLEDYRSRHCWCYGSCTIPKRDGHAIYICSERTSKDKSSVWFDWKSSPRGYCWTVAHIGTSISRIRRLFQQTFFRSENHDTNFFRKGVITWMLLLRIPERQLIHLIYDWTHTVVQPNLLIVHICCNKKDG